MACGPRLSSSVHRRAWHGCNPVPRAVCWGADGGAPAVLRPICAEAIIPNTTMRVLAVLAILACGLLMWILSMRFVRSVPPPAPVQEATTHSLDGLSSGSPMIATDAETSTRLSVPGPALDTSPTESGAACRVRVVDPQYRPLANVQLTVWGENSATSMSKTDEHGVAIVPLPPGESLQIEASLPSYSKEWISLIAPFPSQATVVLEEGVHLSGTVRYPNGAAVGPNCRVLFVRQASVGLPAGVIDKALKQEAAHGLAYTDENGQYTVRDLRRGRAYRAFAALEGWATNPQGQAIVAESETAQDLVVLPLYELHLRWVDSLSGKAFARTSKTLLGYGVALRVNREEGQPLLCAPEVLSFFVGDHQPTESKLDSVEYFLGTPGTTRAELAVKLHTQFVGYQAWSGTLNAARIAAGVRVHTIELIRTSGGFGSLTLRVPDSVRAPKNQLGAHAATLQLHSTGDDTMSFPLDISTRAPQTFDGIPWGTYSVLVCSTEGSFMHPAAGEPPWKVTISAEPVSLTLPSVELGSLLVIPRLPDGSLYSGQLEVLVLEGRHPRESLGKGHKALGGRRTFMGPPYRIDWRTPGEHTVVPMHPRADEVSVSGEVRAGETTELSVSVR